MTNTHPELIAATLDRLAFAAGWLYTSELSMSVTTDMRRFVAKGLATNDEVMTFNPSGYHEVTGQTISRILTKREDVARRVVRRRAEYALKSNVERWRRESETRVQAHVEADTRYVVKENHVQGWVRVYDSSRWGHVNTPADSAVAIFDTAELPLDVARDLAARVKRALVKQAVAT